MRPTGIIAAFGFALATVWVSAEEQRPNVVTLLVDDLGYRDLGCYEGPVKTPVLDKLAAGGVRFTDFHSGAPSCSPSRATFLTGRHHYRAGVYSVITERLHKMHLMKSETTIAEVLKENGYATAHFGKWHLGMPVHNRKNPTPGDHGFDYWFGLVNGPGPSHKNPTMFLRNGKRVGQIKGYSCQIVVDEALTWLDEKREADEPFFLNLWFNEPHAPIAAPDEIVSQYGALDDQAAIYSGTIDNTDRAIGRLVARLEKLGELDNTIIVYSSDNGSYRQERSGELRGQKGSQFEGGHRVPGIFYWKGGIPGGRVEDEPAGVVDLLPTLCGLIGIKKPAKVHLDGSDLTPMLTGSGKFKRHQPLFWMNGGNMVLRMGDHTLFASGTAKSPIDFKAANRLTEQIKQVLGDDLEKVLDGRDVKDLRNRLFNIERLANPEADRLKRQLRDLFYFNEAWIPELKKSELGRAQQLYDLSKDLGQQNNIAKNHPELVARMKKKAEAIHRSVMADAPEWLTPEEQAAAKKPQEHTTDRPATGAPDIDTAKLIARIDKNPVPKDYHGSRHQPYVDKVMAGLKPEQRARVGQLWKTKRRLDSDMPNPGASFVRILTHVAGDAGKSKQPTHGQAFKDALAPLVEASCIDCHDADTKTQLNFEELGHDLSDATTFRQWVKIFDRVEKGEMPPAKEPQPDVVLKEKALKSLGSHLRTENLKQQQAQGRVPVRRLTRLELEYTLQDILGVRGNLARFLPPENDSATFATVADKQGISPLHIRSYLDAADAALDEAIELGPKPRAGAQTMDYRNNRYSSMWFERPLRNGGMTVMKTEDAYVMFEFKPHVAQSNYMGYKPRYPGLYRITAEAYGYQAKTPITFGLYKGSDKQGAAQLIGAFELLPGKTRSIELTEFFTPNDFFYPAALDINWAPDGKSIYHMRVKGAHGYKGEGLAIKWLKIEGPLEEEWPPTRTRQLLTGVQVPWLPQHRIYWTSVTKEPRAHLRDIVRRIAPKTFRRPVTDAEIESFVSLAKPHHPKDQPMHKMVSAPLRAMFSSPQFLFHRANPGPLNDYALATRLSYFLWKSAPDQQLHRLAGNGSLKEPIVLTGQVERMLSDPRAGRFINDFLDGWLQLREIDATTPDEKLYPEFDDQLRQAMLAETRLFFRELLDRNLGVRHFIKSDFTFLNRRLARHYGIDGVAGEKMRLVDLPEDSVRGGLMTQASILKVTANGTLTSPVKRGNFVLTSLLGTPPNPPPPTIEAIEPDIRGAVTIRETLAKHRNVQSCASCHQHIDPPGFALESFNPIGGHRSRYRTTGKGDWTTDRIHGHRVNQYRWARHVDSGGITADGQKFSGIRKFRDLLLEQEEQVARNFISQLVVYSTGGEIEFADREEIERILSKARPGGYGVRKIIHEVIKSRLFSHQ